jgi:Spy/CpxP family protein refolding chaperone
MALLLCWMLSAWAERPSMRELAEIARLSEVQVQSLEELVYRFSVERVEIRARLSKAKIELDRLLSAPVFDAVAVRAAVEALNAAEADLRRNRVELLLAVRAQVSEEQWVIIKEAVGEQGYR